jgi:hypothetical protein
MNYELWIMNVGKIEEIKYAKSGAPRGVRI